MQPKEYFDSHPEEIEEIVNLVGFGFGKDKSFQDIYEHITLPERVFLLRNINQGKRGKIRAFASFNRKNFSGYSSLIVEGVCVESAIQKKGVFKQITDTAIDHEGVICLRTQSPAMYRALESYCFDVNCLTIFPGIFPGCSFRIPESIKSIQKEFAGYLGCKIDRNGVIKGHYGDFSYGKEFGYSCYSRFLEEDLEMDLSKGDAVLLVGINPRGRKIPEDLPQIDIHKRNAVYINLMS